MATLLDLFVVWFFKRPTVFLIAKSERLVNMHGFGLERVAGEADEEPAPEGVTPTPPRDRDVPRATRSRT